MANMTVEAKKSAIEAKKVKLEKEMMTVEIYEKIRESICYDMKWDCMKIHEKDDEHDETWFSVPEEGDYRRPKYDVYEEILTKMDEMFLGK